MATPAPRHGERICAGSVDTGDLPVPVRAISSLLFEPHALRGERGAPVSAWSVPEFTPQCGMYGRERLAATASHAEPIHLGSPWGAAATGRRCQRPFRLCHWRAHRREWLCQEVRAVRGGPGGATGALARPTTIWWASLQRLHGRAWIR